MPNLIDFQCQHRELLVFARAVTPQEPVSPAAAERSRRQLAKLGERITAHLAAEAETISGLCRVGGGALSMACATRQREAEGLLEGLAGLQRRWGRPGAIEESTGEFVGVWQVFLASLQRLHAREEGDIYSTADRSARSGPLLAPPPTGLPGVDRDHDRMFAMIGGLRAAIGGGQRHIDAAMAAELASYSERHMADEEAIMEATAFPGLDDHRREHHLARTILLGFRNDHLDGRMVEAASVLEFLERWLASHIAVVDVAMAEHALAAGWKP
jgi:hemerythrin